MTIDEIRKIAIQLITCIAFLQKYELIHADLKPENILFKKGIKKTVFYKNLIK